jgi:hypothetical protein
MIKKMSTRSFKNDVWAVFGVLIAIQCQNGFTKCIPEKIAPENRFPYSVPILDSQIDSHSHTDETEYL